MLGTPTRAFGILHSILGPQYKDFDNLEQVLQRAIKTLRGFLEDLTLKKRMRIQGLFKLGERVQQNLNAALQYLQWDVRRQTQVHVA